MNVDRYRALSLLLSVVLLVLVQPNESAVTLTSEGILNGKWNIKQGSSVTLKCTITSYMNTMEWRLDSSKVALCTAASCQQTVTGDGAFYFAFDTTSHVFQWTIDPVKLEHGDKKFECYDGSSSESVTATVDEIGYVPDTTAIAIAAVVFAVVDVVASIVIVIVFCYLLRQIRGNRSQNANADSEERHIATRRDH